MNSDDCGGAYLQRQCLQRYLPENRKIGKEEV